MDHPSPLDAGESSSTEPRPLPLGRFPLRPLSPPELILLVGSVPTAVLIALALVDAPDAGVWQNLHWNVSAITAFLAVLVSTRGDNRRERILWSGGVVAIGVWILPHLLWSQQVATNHPLIPSLPDVLAAAVVLPGAVALVTVVAGLPS